MSFIVVVFLFILAFLVNKRIALLPGRLQTILEMLVGYVYGYVEETLGEKNAARRYFPLIASLFLFILAGNMIQFIPGIGSIGFFGHEEFTPLLRSLNTDLNVTLALALISFFVIEYAGISELGGLNYAKKFVNLKSPLDFTVGIIDLFSELARLVSFSFRLFGNIFAGEVVIAVIIFFVPVVLPVPMMLFEVFVGFIQAAIFSLLTLFFIKIARAEAH